MSPELLARFRLKGSVGEGTYGKVYKAKRLREVGAELIEERGFYAIKTIKPSRNEADRPSVTSIATLREISLLRELKHDNIVNLLDVVVDTDARDVALVMDFAEWTLEHIKQDHRNRQAQVSEFCLIAMMYQCLKGLEYMHQSWVLHRDLKPQNILVVGDGPMRGTLQLADFGLARIVREPVKPLGAVDKTVVTLWYRSPELLLGTNHYSSAIDIWSLGCIFAELFFAHNKRAPPALFAGKPKDEGNFFEDQCVEIFKVLGTPSPASWPAVTSLPHYQKFIERKDKSQTRDTPYSPRLQARLSDLMMRNYPFSQSRGFMALLVAMLELNPRKRISATNALKHPFFESQLKRYPTRLLKNALDDPTVDPNSQRRELPKNEAKPLSDEEKQIIATAEKSCLRSNNSLSTTTPPAKKLRR